jgi:hypothetical protein
MNTVDPARRAAAPDAARQPIAPVPAASSPLLPPPVGGSDDAITQMYAVLVESHDKDSDSAKLDLERDKKARDAFLARQREAIDKAIAAENEKHGLFDAMGVGSVIGVATGAPLLVVGDMAMHLAHQTPDFVQKFEQDHAKSVELAATLSCGVQNGAILAKEQLSPEAMRAAVALGGILVQETDVLGAKTSARLGAAMMIVGSPNASAAAAAVVARKDGVVADDIRKGEEKVQPYEKYIEYGGMAVAAAAAVGGSFGTAAGPVVILGVAMSAGGVVTAETKVLDPVLGKKASQWVGAGLMLGGSFMSGAAMATVANEAEMSVATKALDAAGAGITGLAKVHEGAMTVQNAAIAHDVDEQQRTAKAFELVARHFDDAIADITDRARALEEEHAKMCKVVADAAETQAQASLAAASMIRG